MVSICVDDYHRYDRTERKGQPFTALHPDCNYVAIMEQHLALLAAGQPILKPVYSHGTGTPRPARAGGASRPGDRRRPPAAGDQGGAGLLRHQGLPRPARRGAGAVEDARDTTQRGYTVEQVRAELERREPESEAFIRPQRSHADLVVRFAPLEQRGETVTSRRPP